MLEEFAVSAGRLAWRRLFSEWFQSKDAAAHAALLKQQLELELWRNVALIDAIDAEQADQWAPAVLEVAKRLDTTVLESAFLPGAVGEKLRKALDAIVIAPAEPRADADDVDVRTVKSTLPQLFNRIAWVKTIADLGSRPEGLRNVRLKTRLLNIREVLVAVATTLGESDAK